MRNVTAVVMALALIVICSATQAINVTTSNELHHQYSTNTAGSMTQFPGNHMFDGIELTEYQRQRLRDLMQQARYERSSVSADDLDALYDLTATDKFDEAAYRNRLEQIARFEMERQLEIARVRNQLYQILTPDQRAVSFRNHQRHMSELRRLNEQRQIPLQHKANSNNGNQ